MSSRVAWSEKSTYDATTEFHVFSPPFTAVSWQVRLINASATNAATVAIATIDEDEDECPVDGSPFAVGTSAGVELTIDSVNPSLKVTVTGTDPSLTAKCIAFPSLDSTSPGGYGTAVAAAVPA